MSDLPRVLHFIDGTLVAGADDAVFDTIDPTTRRPWAQVSLAGARDVDTAVTAARKAFDEGSWPGATPAERGRVLHVLADLLIENSAELALLDTQDMGRPFSQTRGRDIQRSAANLRFFADDAQLVADESLPGHAGHHLYTRHEPAGVVAAVAPWNFPLMQETWKIAPALAYGNTVVLKPAEQSPASATRLAELAVQAGLPPGVLNVVQGLGTGGAGEALVAHAQVDRITFTGETSTGESIMRAAARGVRPVSLELGGKGASIVFADADVAQAAAVVADAAFSNAGQVCLAGTRLLVQRSVYDELLSALVKVAESMRLGDPRDESTEIGPLVSEDHHMKVSGHIATAVRDGARQITGGLRDGWWIAPTVLCDVEPSMRICREEVFGPVVTVQTFTTEEEAVRLSNCTDYGLSAMVFTTDLGRAHRISGRLRAGNVWVNCFWIRDLRSPFGGMGRSGIGREGGRYSREFFTEAKSVVMDIGG